MELDQLDVDPEEPQEQEEELVPETPRPLVLRQCMIVASDSQDIDDNFPVCLFEVVEDGDISRSVAIVLIAELEHRLVVAVPETAWHRTVARRQLPGGALLRPVQVQVDICDRTAEASAPTFASKVWIGILSPEAEEHVIFAPEETGEPDINFAAEGTQFVPVASSLVAAFEQHFVFASAASGPERQGPKKNSAIESRFQKLEESVAAIADSLKNLNLQQSSSRPSALKKTTSAWQGASAKTVVPEGRGADQDVVRAARAAGIPEEDIKEMATLAARGRPHLTDLPAPKNQNRTQARNALSESEEELQEEDAAEDGDLEGGHPQLVKAVARLTEIAGHLAKDKKKDRSLEALLDGVGSGGGGDSAAAPGGRKHVAALRALRRTLLKNPQQIVDAIEKNMVEDFQMMSQIPGSSAVPVTARAWLEIRSRVQAYQTPVRLLWGIAGVLDAIRINDIPQARARCGLLLAQGDQMSIDRGLWIVAGEISLEEPPPMASFSAHLLPSDAEAPHTRLVDGRWIDLFLQKLADYDQLQDKKRKLNVRRTGKGGDASAGDAAASSSGAPLPKKGAKQKGKGNKDRGGGGSTEPAPDTA